LARNLSAADACETLAATAMTPAAIRFNIASRRAVAGVAFGVVFEYACLTDPGNIAAHWDEIPGMNGQNRNQSAMTKKQLSRCPWCLGSEAYMRYHDEEWGVPVHDDRMLFELLVLEGAQAGLSWSTILNKRDNYRLAFDNFDARRIARYREARVAKLLADTGIVRNRLKIAATIGNAKSFLATQKEFGTFDEYIWRFVGRKTLRRRRRSMKDVPARTPESDAMSRDLLARGFKFVGSTICYAYMQATGMVDDHLLDCHRHTELKGGR
jgi:DNA-3-methyladenine glycosylase I